MGRDSDRQKATIADLLNTIKKLEFENTQCPHDLSECKKDWKNLIGFHNADLERIAKDAMTTIQSVVIIGVIQTGKRKSRIRFG